MDQNQNLRILQHNFKPSARWLIPVHKWMFNRALNPNTSKLAMERIKQGDIKLNTNTKLNSIENMWIVLKSWVSARKHLIELYQLCQEEWSDTQPEICQRLADVKSIWSRSNLLRDI